MTTWRSASDDRWQLARSTGWIALGSAVLVGLLVCFGGIGIFWPALLVPAIPLALGALDWWRDRGRIVLVEVEPPERLRLRRVDGRVLEYPLAELEMLGIRRYRGAQSDTTLVLSLGGRELLTRAGRPDPEAEATLRACLAGTGVRVEVTESHGD